MANSTSARFRKAAESERRRLLDQRSKLVIKADELRGALSKLEGEIGELDQRVSKLNELVGNPGPAEVRAAPEHGATRTLAGREIRETAVRLLVESGQGEAPIHYRDWLRLVEKAGFEISGQRPDAVFLNQIVRSPLVKGGTEAGVYRLDLDVPEKISSQLRRLEERLSELVVIEAKTPEHHAELSDERSELDLEIKRKQRALRESLAVTQSSQAHSRTGTRLEAA